MTTAINLADLPAPDILTSLDFEQLLIAYKAKFVEDYPEIADTIELESEPVNKLLQFAAYRELQLRARYNDEARALLLAYSTGTDLDHIAYTYYRRETRLVITAANPTAFPPIEEVLESDSDFRDRLSLKLESYSTAGPTEAYIYHARSASGLVKDASCTSPSPGISVVTVLSKEGDGQPSAAILNDVENALNVESVRPLCEQVNVQGAIIIPYSLVVGIYTYDGPDTALVLENARIGLQNYTALHHKIGHDHTLTGLSSAAHVAGVQRVTLNLTADIQVNDLHAAYCTSITVNHLGVAI